MSVPIVIYQGENKKNSWARWMVGRTMRKNNNNLVSVIGKTGSGKTWSAISICEMMAVLDGVPFTIDHIVFSLKELMDLINSGKLKRGSKIVFDEPQCSISAREFQSDANKVFNLLVSTFRHRNLSLFFCTPFESLLDKNTRKLFHARFETLSINPNKKTCRLKPRFLEYSDFKPEPYRKRLVVCYKDKAGNSRSDRMFFWDVPKPNSDLIDLYEAKKLEFTDNLNRNITARLNKFDASGKSMTAQPTPEKKAELNPESMQPYVWQVAEKGYLNQAELTKKVSELKGSHISQQNLNKNVMSMRKKGWDIRQFKIKEAPK